MRVKKYLSFPLAFFSLFLTHQLTYFILFPNSIKRHAVLELTGHSWLKNLPTLLVYLGLLILYMLWHSKPELLNKRGITKIALIQYLSFITLEYSERAADGVGVYPGYKILALGLVISIISSFVISLFIEKVITKVIAKIKKIFTTNKEKKTVLSYFSYNPNTYRFKFLIDSAPRSPPKYIR